jgi:hypothetical protein
VLTVFFLPALYATCFRVRREARGVQQVIVERSEV